MEKVVDVFEELELDIPEDGIDRAHRVGKKSRVDDGSRWQSMIVRLHSWKSKIAVYHEKYQITTPKTSKI